MHNKLRELRERRAEGDSGFTLIELLVVVVIIGILIAIAIPLYLNYEKGAKDKSAESDLRGAISTLEQCNTDNGTYPDSLGPLTAGAYAACTGQSINVSGGTTLTYTPAGAAGAEVSYKLTSSNSGGKPTTYCYNSATGGSVTAAATC